MTTEELEEWAASKDPGWPGRDHREGQDRAGGGVRRRGLLTAPARSRGLLGLHSSLVGREAKLAVLTGAHAGLCEGHGGIVALLGEAGKDTEIPVFEDESHGPGRGDRGRPGLSDRRWRWSEDQDCAIVTEQVCGSRLTR